MAQKASRDVLDWFRTYSIGKLNAVGRGDLTANMNVPLTSDPRVSAAIGYLTGIKADSLAVIRLHPEWDAAWEDFQIDSWADIYAQMPFNVQSALSGLMSDADVNVRTLLKLLVTTTVYLTFIDLMGG